MPKVIEGNLIGTGKRFAVVASRFNNFLSDSLIEGAVDVLTRHGVDSDDITLVKCPGRFELPVTAACVLCGGVGFVGEHVCPSCGGVGHLREHKTVDLKIPAEVRGTLESTDVAVLCLGVLIRGGTPHFDYIAAEATKGIATLSQRTGVPITYGILTCDTIEQAIERSGTKAGNKGADAAMAALEMANLYDSLASS